MDIFQEMQMLAMVDESTVLDTRKELGKIVKFWRDQPWQQEQVGFFANMRKLKIDTLNDADGFMVTDDFPFEHFPEELRHDSFGFCKESHFIFSGRFVFPVKDVKGNVMGFVGYDKFEEPKYLDSKNHGYKAKHSTFLGMEKMPEYYESNHLFVVEGSICMLWLRENGFNAVSTLGSYLNPYSVRIFRRFGNRVIFIPDADEAGAKYARSVKSELPQARVLRPLKAKDVDDSRVVNEAEVKIELQAIIKNPFFSRKYFS